MKKVMAFLLFEAVAAVVLPSLGSAQPGSAQSISSQTASQIGEASLIPQPRKVPDDRAARAGIRKLVGKHLTLYTDVPSDPEVDALPDVFDRAVPQWAAYFGFPEDQVAGWRMQAFLIRDRVPFDALGLMPVGNPNFANGISFWNEQWIYEPKSAYYRRHLLLHEGTHGFMSTQLGSCGPGWYMEGIAELLGTHRWDPATGEPTLGVMPNSRDEVPGLARITLVQKAVAERGVPPLEAVLRIDNRRQLKNEAYAWCWALAKFLETHPRYRDRFAKLKEHVRDSRFNEIFRELYAADWSDLNAEWEVFASTLDWGHDIERTVIDFKTGEPLQAGDKQVTLRADRGWQSTSVWFDAGRRYHIAASGRFQIQSDGEVWPCEPGGVTIEYYDGQPVGILMAAVDSQTRDAKVQAGVGGVEKVNGFLRPVAVGYGSEIVSERSGTLYLRVNAPPGKLQDNTGEITATISRNGGQ